MSTSSQMGRLREARAARRMTQSQVADRLAELAWVRDRTRVGVTADMVSKWERGEKHPSREYRELLCELFGTRPDDLGFDETAELLPAGDATFTGLPWADLLIALGSRGGMLHRYLLEEWEAEQLRRRDLLKAMGLAAMASTAGMAPPIALRTALDRPVPRPDSDTIADFEQLAATYQALYHDARPEHLRAPLAAHLRAVDDALRSRTTPPLRRRLLANHSNVSQLLGRVHLFDLNDPLVARGHLVAAYDSAREAGDVALAAAALGHLAFVPGRNGRRSAAADHLEHANKYATQGAPSIINSWLAAVRSEILAGDADERGARVAIDDAKQQLQVRSSVAAPSWFDYYDRSRLAGFEGYTLLRNGRAVEAQACLSDARANLAPDATKQRTVFTTDLASAYVQLGDLDAGCEFAAEAARDQATRRYATCVARLRDFRASLRSYGKPRALRELDRAMVGL